MLLHTTKRLAKNRWLQTRVLHTHFEEDVVELTAYGRKPTLYGNQHFQSFH